MKWCCHQTDASSTHVEGVALPWLTLLYALFTTPGKLYTRPIVVSIVLFMLALARGYTRLLNSLGQYFYYLPHGHILVNGAKY